MYQFQYEYKTKYRDKYLFFFFVFRINKSLFDVCYQKVNANYGMLLAHLPYSKKI